MLSRRLRLQIGRIFQLGPLSAAWRRPMRASRSRWTPTVSAISALFNAFLLGLAGLMATNLVNWLLFEAIGGGVPFVDVMLFNPLIALVLLVPISVGGHGVIQGAYPFFYRLARRAGRRRPSPSAC